MKGLYTILTGAQIVDIFNSGIDFQCFPVVLADKIELLR